MGHHTKGEFGHNRMHIRIEHANKMGLISFLKREQNLPTLLFDDGREKSVLEGLEVYDMLSLYASIMEKDVVMISCLLTEKHSIGRAPRSKESWSGMPYIGSGDLGRLTSFDIHN